MRVRPIVAVLLLLATPHLESQEPTNFGATLDVRIINVDVVVRDKAGQLVTGLTANDFVIYEKGKPQPITNFAEYREAADEVRPEAGEATAVVTKPPEKRHLVFFFDRLDLRETIPRQEFFAGLRSFVMESMRSGDSATVYFFDTSLVKLLPMTNDRSALLAEIDKFEEQSKLRIDVADTERAELAMRERMFAADGAAMSANNWKNDAGASAETNRRFFSQRAYDRQRRQVFAIKAVIQALSGLDGRKVMILAANRISKFPGLEYGYTGKDFNARSMMDDIVDSANASGVTIYAYFPKGLPMDPMNSGGASYEILMNDSEVLDIIATRTGGTFAMGGRLSAANLGDAAKQLDNYYSLAYRAPDSRSDRTRAIKVEVKLPGLEVQTRSAVVDKSEDELARDRMISSILFGLAPSTIPISLKQGQAKRKGLNTLIVPVEITIPIAELTALPGRKGYEGSFRVLALASGRNGDLSEIAEKKQAFNIPLKDFEKSRTRTFTYTLEIIVRDTSDRALVAVIDDLDKDVGYAEVVLDLTKVEKAQPVTNTRPKWQPIAAPPRPPGAP